jgi:hypothetical protein
MCYRFSARGTSIHLIFHEIFEIPAFGQEEARPTGPRFIGRISDARAPAGRDAALLLSGGLPQRSECTPRRSEPCYRPSTIFAMMLCWISFDPA